MIDPHGEYSAAFKSTGEIFDVGNLAMPYWLMNFEEHCEVFVTGTIRNPSSIATSSPNACWLRAPRAASPKGITKLTVDSPVPYLLSELLNIIQLEMGKMDKSGTSAPYMRLKTKIEELRADPRYSFMFSACWSATAWPRSRQDLPLAGWRQADLDR
jgi:hypothetical protein